jgi:hypothetical protein
VTNFWEHLFSGKSQDESGEAEARQALVLAQAAANCKTLEHYIWSTLPAAKKQTDAEVCVPHFDYKAEIDDRIRKEMPQLASKTTFLFVGSYNSNIAFYPMLKPFELASFPNSSTCVLLICVRSLILGLAWSRR